MSKHINTLSPDSATRLIFLSTMFEETIHLLSEAQDYFTANAAADQQSYSSVEKLVYASEMSRITLRLSSIMAWLMARRAECTGEITAQEAASNFRLAFPELCMQEMPEMHHVLPDMVCALLSKSLDIYQRAARLDELLAEDAVKTLH